MSNLPNKIEITISGNQEFNSSVYTSNEDCYMAQELKKLGYKDIEVFGFGETKIADEYYKPESMFLGNILRSNMSKNINTHITLIKTDKK